MSGKWKYALMAAGLGFVAYMIVSTGIDEIAGNLVKVGWAFVPIVALWAIVYAMNTGANAMIVNSESQRIPFARLLSVNIAGFAINYITPFIALGGESYRAMALSGDLGRTKSVSSTILYNMLHVLSHLFFWLTGAAIFVVSSEPTASNLATAGVVSLVLIGLVAFFFARHRKGIFRSAFAIMRKSSRLGRMLSRREKFVAECEEMDLIIREFYERRRGRFYCALALEYGARVLASVEIMLILNAVGHSITFADAVYINAFSSLIMNLAFFMPLELGSREAGMMASIGSLAQSAEIGIFVSVVNRLREMVWILIGMACMKLFDSGQTAQEE